MGQVYGSNRDKLLCTDVNHAFAYFGAGTSVMDPLFVAFATQWFLCLMTTAGRGGVEHASLLWSYLWRYMGGRDGEVMLFLRKVLWRALHSPVECIPGADGANDRKPQKWTIAGVA